MKLSENFSLEEFTRSESASRRGIKNEPTEAHKENIALLCKNILQPLRDRIQYPIRITSGYRSLKLNSAIGGSKKSQHSKGQAADFVCDEMNTHDLWMFIKHNLDFDQLILEFYDEKSGSGWVHCSYNSLIENRNQTLTAKKVRGKTVYAKA